MTTPLPAAPLGDPESLAELIGDCRKMAAHWEVPAKAESARVAPSSLHGITVPAASSHVVEGMAEYAD
ncbi:hypothetical protein [Streptomyces sp. NPDC026673]|uniref:hypothetical protein n=1 Tax=Streptomyces sp. NPDC026673 TaxID=3155724 RepID=UPI0033FEC8C8